MSKTPSARACALLLCVAYGCGSPTRSPHGAPFSLPDVASGTLGLNEIGARGGVLGAVRREYDPDAFATWKSNKVVAVHALRDWKLEGEFPENVGVSLGEFVGLGSRPRNLKGQTTANCAFFSTDDPQLWVSYVATGELHSGMLHRAVSLEDVVTGFVSPQEALERLGDAGQTRKVDASSQAMLAALKSLSSRWPAAADAVARYEGGLQGASANALAELNAWDQAAFERTTDFDARLRLFAQLVPALTAALALEGTPAAKRADELLGILGQAFAESSQLALERQRGQTPFRFHVHTSLAGTRASWWKTSTNRRKLLELPQRIRQADALPGSLDSAAGMHTVFPQLAAFGSWSWATFDQQAGYRTNAAAAADTSRRLRGAGHPRWALVEEGLAKLPFFRVTAVDVEHMRRLLDAYPAEASFHERCAWFAAHRTHREKRAFSQSVFEASRVWNHVRSVLVKDLWAEVEPELAALKSKGLEATALVQRGAITTRLNGLAASVHKLPESGPPWAGTPGLRLLVELDPPFAGTNGEARALIARLHGEPWLERPLLRVFGLDYRSPLSYRMAAKALEVDPGHVRLTKQSGAWQLTRVADAPLVSVSPWFDFSVAWAATSAETRELGSELRALRAQIDTQSAEVEAKSEEISAWAKRIDARIQRWNRINARGEGTRAEQDGIRQEQARFNTARDAAEAQRRTVNALIATRNAKVPLYNTRLNRERSAARREHEAEQDAVLRAWFEEQLVRRKAYLEEAEVSERELALELGLTRWLLGLGPRPETQFAGPQGDSFVDAPGFAKVKLEAVEETLWERGDSAAIAAGVLKVWELMAQAKGPKLRLQAITPTVTRYVSQYDPKALYRLLEGRSDAQPLLELARRLRANVGR